WGVDPATLDPAVMPGDDFFAYVNRKWIDANPIPAEFSRFGAFTLLGEKSTADVKALVDELVASNPTEGTTQRRILDAYQAFLDTGAIEARGMSPAVPYLNRIFAAPDLEALVAVGAEPGIPGLVAAAITIDSKSPTDYAVSVGFDGMGLPDRDYYLVDNDRNREIQAKYKEYLAFLLGKAGYPDAVAAAAAVYAFE